MNFDNSLPTFCSIIDSIAGQEALGECVFFRDAIGKLTVYVPGVTEAQVTQVRERASAELAPYIDPEYVVLDQSDAHEHELLSRARPFFVEVNGIGRFVNLVENRIVGQDWWREPAPGWRIGEPARLAFWSLKGGVGRTTAIAIAGLHLSRRGKRVLVMDLDLEAPGVGSILLSPEQLPQYGTLDWFVENGLTSDTSRFISNISAPCQIEHGSGILDVVPAIGLSSQYAPENVIPKLGRAYIEDINPDQSTSSFSEQTDYLLTSLLEQTRYDVVLIDARAGLNEATPAALFGLGADILMFGVNTLQTFEGYAFLLSYLRGLPVEADNDWRYRLKMVHAKALPDRTQLFHDRSFDLFSRYLYEEESGTEAFNFDLDDPTAPHFPWVIQDDSRYGEFEPLQELSQVQDGLYRATFGNFLEGLDERVEPTTV